MKIVERVGPVTVAVHADEEFMSYSEGFYRNDDCPKDDPNHAMVVCGWGSDKNFGDFWLVRNSWGELKFESKLRLLILIFRHRLG